jgi:SAM-dependent methyltransferase
MSAYTALCTYLVQPDKVEQFSALLHRHWPTLRRHSLVTEAPPIIYFGEDYSGPFFVEIITWVDSSAPGKAYWTEEVNEIWTDLYNFTEARGGRPGIDYPTVKRLNAAGEPLREADSGRSARADRTVHWDELYRDARYLECWECEHGSPELRDFLAGQGAPSRGTSALDLGCGSGSDCLLLAEAGYRTSGVDASPDALRIAATRARSAGLEVSWHQANVLQLPFADASFQLVTDRGCFHHIAESERSQYAREVGRILSDGGTLFLRGCRIEQFPFVPITLDSLPRHFSEQVFEFGPLTPVDMVTNTRSLAGIMCVIRKRKGDSLCPQP